MLRPPPRSTRTDTLFPYTTLFRSHPDLFMTALEIEEISRPRFTTVEGMWRKSTKKRSGSWVEWAIGEGLVKRNGDGNLLHIPATGPLPTHPDDEIIDRKSTRLNSSH